MFCIRTSRSLVQAGLFVVSSNHETENEEPESLVVLEVEHILFPLIILCLGNSVAFMVFLFEIWFCKTNEDAEHEGTGRYEEGNHEINALVDIQSMSTDPQGNKKVPLRL